jgi:hypothetical protein
MKRAYFVLGVESAGTRMLTRAFISAGCYGDGDHGQRLDNPDFNNLPDKIVFRRSIPHAGGVPDVGGWVERFIKHGYKVEIIKVRRNETCNIESLMRQGHAGNRSIARAKYGAGNKLMDKLVGTEIIYRRFVTDDQYRREQFKNLGLPEPEMEFYDGDAKYL